MGGFILLGVFLISGVLTSDALLRRKSALQRLWFGLALGLVLMMWLPALFAFFVRFTASAQLCGAAVAIALSVAAQGATRRIKRVNLPFFGNLSWKMLVFGVLPLLVLSAYLQYTHCLRPDGKGMLHVGQSTYGDLSLHLGIATSLRNAAFPPDYSILRGTLLGYPFLGDSMVTSMLLLGTPLSTAYIATGTLMMALMYVGFLLFALEITGSRRAASLAFVLLFLNGGLGFCYVLDGVMRDPSAFLEVFTGFYRTPTNMTELNVRWVNLLCDMLIPQRTFLTGWMMLMPALWLLATALREKKMPLFILLGVWAGTMPMAHTHSFLALGLISAGCLAVLLRKKDACVRSMLLYGAIAVALALPQLITWSVPQTVGGGSLNLRPNWVNNTGNGTLIDEYFWFWIKNVGLVYILLVPAVWNAPKGSRIRMFGLGALIIYAIAELIQFQPNPYDNNKLFYAAYMATLPAVGLFLTRIWDRLRGVKGRALLAAVFMAVCTLSGALTIGREIVSDYVLFDDAEVRAAAYIEENAPEHAVVLTGNQHKNAVAALTGRYIVCGTDSYLYFHGLDSSAQWADMRDMLEEPEANRDLFEEYRVEYVYISECERSAFDVDVEYFENHCDKVFSSENAYGQEIAIYAVKGARS